MDKIGEFDREEASASAILDLMCRMLAFRSEDRPTAEVLNSECMVRWALPDFQRSLQTQ
ncbi:unnamed protein product [Penicillium nalgiovense]|nr:unnamed protein product [Penicillium nalgiovense]